MTQQTKWSQFGTLVLVFFFWGFVAASNDILIPVFKEKLHLLQWQSQMISFAFYVAYTVGSIIYYFLSKASGGDILNRIGYKNGISLGLAFLVVAVIFRFSSIPNKIAHEEEVSRVATPTDITDRLNTPVKTGALNYTQLLLGMIGIFVYVGVEVSTASNLPEFMKQHVKTANGLPFPTENIAPYVSLFWASLMIGRWTNSVGAFNVSANAKSILRFIMPYIAFGIFLLVTAIAKHDISHFYIYGFVIIALIIGDLLSRGNPARQLLIFSLMGITALIIGMASDGMMSVYAFISVGLFCSTLWPCIFTLAIAGLGRHTNQGASFLIMMIMGGGFISLLQGYLAGNNLLGIQMSYLVGVACFAYLAFYAVKAKSILKTQGIDYDIKEGGGH